MLPRRGEGKHDCEGLSKRRRGRAGLGVRVCGQEGERGEAGLEVSVWARPQEVLW